MLNAEELNEQLGTLQTPCYLLDEDTFLRRLRYVKDIAHADITFSIKANPHLTELAAAYADYLEICSPGELRICIRKGIAPEKIVLAGVCKLREYLMDALAYGVSRYVIESEHQLRLLCECLRNFPERIVRAALRLNIGNQFGMFREEAEYLFSNCPCDRVQIDSLHIYAGTQNRNGDKHRRYLEELSSFALELNRTGHGSIKRLIYGSGLPVSYFTGPNGFDDRQVFEELSQIGNAMYDTFQLEFELGRYLAAPCGCYITRVCERRERDKIYIIADGGTHQLTYYNQQYGRRIPSLIQIPERADREKCVVCGVLCTGADIMLYDALLGQMQAGDYLIFENVGAYSLTDGAQLFLSQNLPSIYMKKSNGELIQVRGPVDTGI